LIKSDGTHYCPTHDCKFYKNPSKKITGTFYYSHKIKGEDGAPCYEPKEFNIPDTNPQPAPSHSVDHREGSIDFNVALKAGVDLMVAGKAVMDMQTLVTKIIMARLNPVTMAAPPLDATPESIFPEPEGGLDIEWLKQEMQYLTEHGVKGYDKLTLMARLKVNFKVEGKTLTEMCSKLTADQASRFMAEVLVVHAKTAEGTPNATALPEDVPF
jgi:hypothetical protein